jgi:hypothetical protein
MVEVFTIELEVERDSYFNRIIVIWAQGRNPTISARIFWKIGACVIRPGNCCWWKRLGCNKVSW